MHRIFAASFGLPASAKACQADPKKPLATKTEAYNKKN